MKSVGQLLKDAREAKFYTLEEIEKHTKIRKELLTALEKDDFSKLPPLTFIQGFIKNYGKFLGLDTEKLLAVLRRDYETHKHPPVVLETFANPMHQTKFRITPARILGAVISLVIITFFAYLWFEYRQFVSAPPLTVTSPQDQQTVDIPQVLVEGKTDPEVKIKVNDQDISVDQEGKFSEEIKLSSSSNKVIIAATSKFGKTVLIERAVFVKK
ncbi:hypothetical protein A2631_04500 [Candidatus Daviesbacteria bacterium RIFCSPHIGHO2_01_FULL_44_29]|uniref:HTH cro/C1-type domain-containing protein n=1 Tax=Candidatus Daviesbacteria bacterium RIFCSPHIGHO2_02_FULL_43_12 TaxID=1797776 RepID=A0A1F5KGA6_9BACT|nr:MAG: hypothetical protein A2631_04500 [Candidatus Daviesbacteria bacterium RIFCSPHIGHO2_01_FULL_44_29]OGE39602.1 MAG: hypothetical protein A3E86_05655 [Candidatus Daviesbacteria bacterium RIFCSPHIGHO2_12_FULL_47_45]OGE39983.1 MAG: hypothetical protein A3D25_04230 [Candidatus Daviesbacteria bacterium RIFCSPHIGHO2_02_FULL_43_12]OGE70336.1 MAG: hypothetical protein A3B55_01340 [Candidatus Daviesbacteria bacterium RIFCSPLOWO2_01_FULL_43_15]